MVDPRPLWDAQGAQKADSTAISLPRGGRCGWVVSEAADGCDKLNGWLRGLGLIPPRLAVRWAQRQMCC